MAREATLLTVHRSVRKTARLTGVFVTIETEIVALTDQQGFIFRSVRVVAGKTITRLKRLVLHFSVPLHGITIVAAQAKLFSRNIQTERLFVRCGIVAGITFRLSHRTVQAGLQ